VAYVYLIYGMYHCLNVVTEPEGVGSAVLIRALDPLVTGGDSVPGWTRRSLGGPGRLCREFGVDLRMNGWDLTRSKLRILEGPGVPDSDVVVGPRVGLKRSADLPLRFRVRS
jgi:DNA-3-methyladenine glycosylase